MVLSGLHMLHDSVNISSDNLIAVASPGKILQHEQTTRLLSISQVLCSQIDSVCFTQLSEAAMIHLHLAHYRNQLLHLFVKDAMLALCLAPQSDYGNLQGCLTQFFLGLLVFFFLATVQKMFFAVHCALASEFILSRKSAAEVGRWCCDVTIL